MISRIYHKQSDKEIYPEFMSEFRISVKAGDERIEPTKGFETIKYHLTNFICASNKNYYTRKNLFVKTEMEG